MSSVLGEGYVGWYGMNGRSLTLLFSLLSLFARKRRWMSTQDMGRVLGPQLCVQSLPIAIFFWGLCWSRSQFQSTRSVTYDSSILQTRPEACQEEFTPTHDPLVGTKNHKGSDRNQKGSHAKGEHAILSMLRPRQEGARAAK